MAYYTAEGSSFASRRHNLMWRAASCRAPVRRTHTDTVTGTTMIHTIRLDAGTHLEAVRAALVRVPDREVALVFPLGQHCALAESDALAALHQDCETQRIAAVIIGGDAALRAAAVAAGFAAATSLDEWETGQHRAVSPADGQRTDASSPRASAEPSYLYVLGPEADDSEPGLYDPTGEDPPAYVVDLLPTDTTPPVERYAAIPTIPRVRTPAQERRDEARREAAQTAALERAQHAYEEHVTRTIRATGAPAPSAASHDSVDAATTAQDDVAPVADAAGSDSAEAEGN